MAKRNKPRISFQITSTTFQTGTPVTLALTVTDLDNNLSNGLISWGDGSANTTWGVSPPATTSHTYTTVGTFTITAREYDTTKLSTSVTKNVTITDSTVVTVSSVSVLGPTPVTAGTTAQYTAHVIYSDGTSANFTTAASWTSSQTGYATIGASTGLLTGVSAGTTVITATYSGKSGTESVVIETAGSGGGSTTAFDPATRGIQTSVTMPDGAVTLSPSSNIQSNVNNYPAGTAFWLTAGVYSITGPITPKSGNSFVGEYGATIDGSNWITTDLNQGAFRSHNQNIDNVTIKNLVIRNMPQRGVHAYKDFSDNWTIQYCEIFNCKTGVVFPNNSNVLNNYIHDCKGDITNADPALRGGGYGCGSSTVNVVLEGNEISYNGPEQKVTLTTNVTFRHNYCHHNYGPGIWYDGDNLGALIEDNTLVHNGDQNSSLVYPGIQYEISGLAVIRNNTVTFSGDAGLFLSNSQDVEAYNNTFIDNFRGVTMFLDFGNVYAAGQPYAGAIGWDLKNLNIHDNQINITAAAPLYSLASLFGYAGSGTITPYTDGTKSLVFDNNDYDVVNTTASYWLWANVIKTFTQWQSIPQDATGSVS